MLRHAVVYQLVLSLLAGPALCCCATARPADATAIARTAPRSPARTCCGHAPKPADGDRTPAAPAKCPCKGAPAKAVAVPKAAADSLGLPVADPAPFDRPVSCDPPAGPARSILPADRRTPSTSTADLLFAHHNLRC